MDSANGPWWTKLDSEKVKSKEYFVLKFTQYLKGKTNARLTDTYEKEAKRVTDAGMPKVRKDVMQIYEQVAG